MSYHKVARKDGLHVLSKKCSTCIFRSGNPMHLRSGRVKDMVETCLSDQGVIPCHKTITGDVDPSICRGFYDAYGERIQLVQIAMRMGFIIEDDLIE